MWGAPHPPDPIHSPLPSPTQDSGAYFLHMLWNLYSLPGYGREALLAEATVYEAASLLVDVWATELHHEQRSTYRYSELAREGRGPPSNYTGGAGRGGVGGWGKCAGSAWRNSVVSGPRILLFVTPTHTHLPRPPLSISPFCTAQA